MKEEVLKIIDYKIESLRAEISVEQQKSNNISNYICTVAQVNILRELKYELNNKIQDV